MGLFDRFRKTVSTPAPPSSSDPLLAEQDAARLLDEGLVLEQPGQVQEALGPVSYTHLDVYKRQHRRHLTDSSYSPTPPVYSKTP